MTLTGSVFPVHLLLSGRPCLVVGGGRIATRKTQELLNAGAIVDVITPELTAELSGLSVNHIARTYQPGDVEGYWLVIAATGDAVVNQAVHQDGERAHIWVNSVDDMANCSYITPAIARQGSITVSISTGGRSPALASWLRRNIETQLSPAYLDLLDDLEQRRNALHEQQLSSEGVDWDAIIERVLAS